MFKNYLKIALRNFLKHKTYSFINVFGLALGLACCLLIIFYVRHEISFDAFHDKSDRIYRIIYEAQFGGHSGKISSTPAILAPLLAREFPEVESTVRLYPRGVFGPVVINYQELKYLEEKFFYADSTFFAIFRFQLLLGDPATALSRPNTIVITESTARRLFGGENPLGKTLRLNNLTDFEVTGVAADVPANSHLQFDYVASFTSLREWESADETTWGPANFVSYLVLKDENLDAALQKKISARVEQELGRDAGHSYTLQPLREIRLYSQDIRNDIALRGDIGYVYGFSAIAALVLLVACINYMSLSTARSARRAKEVGVRKVVGAHRGFLTVQFIGESVITTITAVVLAIGLVELFLPGFNAFIGGSLQANYFENPAVLSTIVAMVFVVSLVAGSYPALVLSGFKPVRVLKGERQSGTKGARFRKLLVVFQFAVSVFLIVGTVVVNNQLDYLRHKKLGFRKDQIVILPMADRALRQNYEPLKATIQQDANVLSATAVSSIPGKVLGGYVVQPAGRSRQESPLMTGWIVDPDFAKTAEIELVTGRDFTRMPAHSEDYDFLLNEAAVRKIGWTNEEALGKALDVHGRKGPVIGVVKDFHFASLHSAIEPLILYVSPQDFSFLLVKIGVTDISRTLGLLSQKWVELAPHRPFEYRFLDQEFDALYRAEVQVQRFFTLFAILAIFIACLGLFGLAAFTAEQRTKEVGIRKVLGASVASIVLLLTKEFTRFVVLAIVLAGPIAYLVMNNWLRNFAYRIDIGVLTIMVAGVTALAIALATVSYQAVRAAVANPIESLRYE